MARYKPTISITMTMDKNSDAVKNVNRIAKERDRAVHDVADAILREASDSHQVQIQTRSVDDRDTFSPAGVENLPDDNQTGSLPRRIEHSI